MEESNCERDNQAHTQADSTPGYRCVPEIRFRGFTYAWERQRLGGVSEFYSGGTPSVGIKEYYGGEIPFIRSAEINSEVTELFLTKEGLKNSSARLVDIGDILYALYGATSGEVGRARLKGAINQAILAIKPHMGYNSEYLTQWLRKSKHKIIETYLQGGQGNLSGTIVKELLVDFPSLTEQQKIGITLRSLDSLVTLHQRKLTKLHHIKKALLEKMFPTPGSTIPDIRFQGFTETWELHKVGDFLTESQIRGNTGLEAKKLTVKLRGKGVVEKNDVGGSEHTRYFIRRKGQFIYSKLDFLNAAFGVIPENLDTYESTADLPAFDLDGMNPYFMLFTATQKNFYLKHGSIADGSRKAKRIHTDTFLNMPITVPTIDEQNFVVSCFQYLDSLATLHQHKLNKLHCIKKALLEKMFV